MSDFQLPISDSTSLDNVKVSKTLTLFIPYWIKQILARNTVDYIDLLNYSSLRAVMSVEDMAEFYYGLSLTQESKNPRSELINALGNNSWLGLSNLWAAQSPDAMDEFTRVIEPLAHSPEIRESVMARLTLSETDYGIKLNRLPDRRSGDGTVEDMGTPKYHTMLAVRDDLLLIFVERGFINNLSIKSYQQVLLADYLKLLYGSLSLSVVSRDYDAFRLYIDSL